MDEEMISKTEHKLSLHEAVCAERYEKINESLDKGAKRMTRIEYMIYIVVAAVLLGPGVAADLFRHLFHY